MECDFGLPELVSHNPFVKHLDEVGYLIDFVGGYFVIYGLPYLDKEGSLKYGDWLSPLDLSKDGVIDAPKNHQAWWHGNRPHDNNKRELPLGGGAHRIEVTKELVTDHSFSFKLKEGGAMRLYQSFEEKVQTYLDTITAPARAAFPDVTPLSRHRDQGGRPRQPSSYT